MPRLKRKREKLTVRSDKLSRQNIILYCFGTSPVIWLGLLIAPYFNEGIVGLVKNFGEVMNNPFRMSFQSHDPSQRSNGFLTLAGGIIITFAKEILNLIVGCSGIRSIGTALSKGAVPKGGV